jgi:CubicO group peptidase (beta-lactamase class C family)
MERGYLIQNNPLLGEEKRNMKNKIIGIFVCMLMMTTCIVPVIADTIKNTSNEPLNDTTFDLKMKILMRLVGYPSLTACIIKGDQIIWSKGYGYYDRSEQKPATPDTVYNLGSITKTIVGTALMQLYERGLFGLDDDVNTVLPFSLRNPNFPNDPITFRMLLSHTSSLNDNDYTPNYYWLNFSGDPPFSFFPEPYLREFLVPGGRWYSPSVWSTEHRPGEYGIYANVGFEIISYLVELISGEPFLEYCDTHIFSPLDMKHTGFNLSHFDLNQVAIPYQRYMGRYYTINELSIWWGKNNTPPDKYWRERYYAAGGLYSTVNDLSHFLIAHMNDGVYNGIRILKKETVELMHTILPGNLIGSFWYGLGWLNITWMGITVSGHGGGNPGVQTIMVYNQTSDVGVIYFADGSPLYPNSMFYYGLFFYLLYTKEGTFRGEIQHDYTIKSDPILYDIFDRSCVKFFLGKGIL